MELMLGAKKGIFKLFAWVKETYSDFEFLFPVLQNFVATVSKILLKIGI